MPADEIIKPESEYPIAFAARNPNESIRRRSSSGGAFHALASYVITNLNGVVYGCAFNEFQKAIHVRCETLEEVGRCMGSKYSQSDMGNSIQSICSDLEEGRFVLFTGTPCQVAAVRLMCQDPRLLTADLVCHGVPSPLVFQDFLSTIESVRGKQIVGYEHRPKTAGWGHYEKALYHDGTPEQATRLISTWKNYFYDNRSLRPSCYSCPFATTRREGDITIADFWGIENTSSSRSDDYRGVSLLLVNSDAGKRLLPMLELDMEEQPLSAALPRNPMLCKPSTFHGERAEVWSLLYSEGFLSMSKKERFLPPLRRSLVAKFKYIAKRILRGR